MNTKSSGVYVIDQNYNVVSCNETMRQLYPQLMKGRKCHECLMNLDEPCPACPVAKHIYGPQTYMDPIREIYETVDAVEVELEDGSIGHALILSTVGDKEKISAQLPNSRAELERLLEHEYYDSLTEAYSRKGFIREVEHLFKNADPCDYSMVLFDLRSFKALNEVFGNRCGDQILQFVFHTLKDSWLKPLVSARVESDWFIYLVNKSTLKLNHLEDLLNLQWSSAGRSVHLHLRCGIYPIDSPDTPVSRMVDWTILAKEAVDRRESGNIAVFDSEMQKTYVTRAEILSSFQNSLQNNEIKIYFQPIVQCRDGKICSAEALARWEHPKMGYISPADFIPILEQNGLVAQLDQYILKKLYHFQESLLSAGLPCIPVSINLSRQDFYSDRLMNDIFRLRSESRIPRGLINYEVTETSIAVLKENCIYYLNQLRENGASVLLDDFGSGYSSLGIIGNYSFDIIKIDKSFIDRIEKQPVTRSNLMSIIEMCHKSGKPVVAEGVETKFQEEFLRANGCDYIQGYYYYRPMREVDFRKLLSSQNIAAEDEQKNVWDTHQNVDKYNLMDLVDHCGQFIQVCHPEDYSMVYANAMTLNISGHPQEPYEGRKCYEYMLGLNAPCGHCPMKKMGNEKEKEIETDDGAHIFRLKARITEWNGKKVFIEYGREITNTRRLQDRYTSQIRSILETIPEGQGVFHVDLTADRWISSGGNAENAKRMQNQENVDDLIHNIASFVPNEEGKEKFFRVFCRKAQLKAYADGQHQIVLETKSYYDDRSIRWSRITAHLIDNPANGHVESILYGVDISRESRHVEELEMEQLHARQETEILQKQMKEVMEMYSQADHDRRYDSLTGLYSRLCLYDFLKEEKQKDTSSVAAVLMVDFDNFKNINDSYGHAAGDLCLKECGKLMLEFGIENHISFYRYGGDEFVGFLINGGENVSQIVSELRENIQNKKFQFDNHDISLTVSIGYTTCGKDYQDMINKADSAMHVAKNKGKNQICGGD